MANELSAINLSSDTKGVHPIDPWAMNHFM